MGETFTLGARSAVNERSVGPYQDGLDGWRAEIADFYSTMRVFNDADPTEVFMQLSQFSGRASEIRSKLTEHEGRREANFRIKVIDPFIEECDRQFKIHSRLQAIREMDAKLAGGRFT